MDDGGMIALGATSSGPIGAPPTGVVRVLGADARAGARVGAPSGGPMRGGGLMVTIKDSSIVPMPIGSGSVDVG